MHSEGGSGLCLGYIMGSFHTLIGALIMTHSDDNGLVLPPNLAPFKWLSFQFIKVKRQQLIAKQPKRLNCFRREKYPSQI